MKAEANAKGTSVRQTREDVLAELALCRGAGAVIPDTKAIDVDGPETEDEKSL